MEDVNKDESNGVKLGAIRKARTGRRGAATKSDEIGLIERKQVDICARVWK